MLFKILSLGANARTKVAPQLDLALAASESVALVSIINRRLGTKCVLIQTFKELFVLTILGRILAGKKVDICKILIGDKMSIDKISVVKMSVDKMSVDKMSVDKMSVDKMSAGETAVDKMSVDEMSVDKMSVDKMSVDKMSLYGYFIPIISISLHLLRFVVDI